MWDNHLYISFLSPIVLALHFLTSVFLSQVSVCVCVHVCLVLQWCLNFCDPMDSSLSSSSVHGIFQARILQWVAISYSRGSSYYIPKHIYRNTHTHIHTDIHTHLGVLFGWLLLSNSLFSMHLVHLLMSTETEGYQSFIVWTFILFLQMQ